MKFTRFADLSFFSNFAIKGLIFGEKSRSRAHFSFEHRSADRKKKGF